MQNRHSLKVLSAAALAAITATLLGSANTASAGTYTVTSLADTSAYTSGTLRWAIQQADLESGTDSNIPVINFNIAGGGTINLVGVLPVLDNPNGITINGSNGGANNIKLDGGRAGTLVPYDRIFFIGLTSDTTLTGTGAPTATPTNAPFTIQNLTLQNGAAVGGQGSDGGGGGAGLGGAIFLNAGSLSLGNVSFSGNNATGGGLIGSDTGFGGGGGLGGGGGAGAVSSNAYGGGGGGFGQHPVTGVTGANNASGSRNGGSGATGGSQTGEFTDGTFIGALSGVGYKNASPTGFSGGGGGSAGGSGSNGGGGGGGLGGSSTTSNGAGGIGGFGGGGGGTGGTTAAAGYGGFGGGGGAGKTGGNGGFGAGGGKGTTTVGTSGFGGGTASKTSGAGGAGLGGAIFVRQGATLNVTDGTFAGDSAVGGATGAYQGTGTGAAIFLAGSATYTVDSAAGALTINESIGGGNSSLVTGGFIKAGGGTLTLSGSNTYVGGTAINAGTVIGTTATALGNGQVSVAGGSGMQYAFLGTSDAQMTLPSLSITGGPGTTIGGTVGSGTGTNMFSGTAINVTGAVSVTGSSTAVTVNVFGNPNVPTGATGNFVLLSAVSGISGGNYTLGNVYDNTAFVITNPSSPFTVSDTALAVGITQQASLFNAYWTGGYAGGNNVWAISDGYSTSNWTATSGGPAQPLIPGSGTAVVISANAINTAPTGCVLGANMAIKNLTLSDTTNGLRLNPDGNTLTITNAGGINLNSGVPTSIIGANIALGVGQSWTNFSNNPLVVTGSISGAYGLSTFGPMVLGGSNTFTGGLTISSGSLIATNGSALNPSGGGAVTVSSSAILDYFAATDGPLGLHTTLSLTGNTAIGGSIGSTTTSSKISVTGPVTASGAIKVNVYGITNLPEPATSATSYTLLSAASGVNGGTYSLGSVYNNTNFTVDTPSATATALTVNITGVSQLASAYWVGGFASGTNVWAISDGSANSNWAATAGGSVQGLVPGSTTAITISASSVNTAPNPSVLGANMSIGSLVIADTTNGLALAADGNTLTIAGAAGITMNAGVPTGLIASDLALSTAQTWTNNATAPLTTTGAVSAGVNLLTFAGSGPINIAGYAGISTAGGFTVSGGAGNTGQVTISAPLNATAAQTWTNNSTTPLAVAGAVTLGGNLAVAGSGPINISSLISGIGSLTMQSSGTLSLNNAKGNTYSGGTTITSGTLLAGNTSNSATGSGAVNVSGGTLAGTGTISGTVTINPGGTIMPGSNASTPGTLTTGSQTWTGGGNYTWILELSGPVTGSGLIEMGTNTLDISNLNSSSPFNIQVSRPESAPQAANASYVIAEATTLNIPTFDFGTFNPAEFSISDTTGLDTWAISVATNSVNGEQELVLTGTPTAPEPGTLSLLGVATIGLLRRRHRNGGRTNRANR